MRYGILAGLAAAAMTALVGLGTVTAQAATATNVSAPAAGTTISVRANTTGTLENSAAKFISCKPSYSAPHISTHVPTEINSEGTVKCTHSMASIVIALHLTSNDVFLRPVSRTCRNSGKGSNTCQLNLTCYPNVTYAGGVSMTLTAPPNYEPPKASWSRSGSFKVDYFC